ncbi:MAG: DUF1566 domain-containing protein, partial [Oligoflexales bacterium]
AANIKTGITIAGVAGSVVEESHSNCSTDGTTGCVTVAGYKSADMTKAIAANIKTGITIAGVAGSVVEESHSNCSTDGTTGCVTVAGYKSADMTKAVATNIKTGITIAGVAGTVVEESHSNCSADGITGCVTVAGYKSADMTKAVAGNIKSGITIAGTAGSIADCSADGTTGCITVAAYKSADMTKAVAGNIKSGITIAGAAGSAVVIADASGTPDLTALTFTAKIKDGSNSFEYWDSTGTRHTGTGDTDLNSVGNVKNGVDIFGTTGTWGADCTGDGQTACMTTAIFKSANTGAYTTWDIRKGKTVGGVVGDLVFYRSMKGTFNRTGGTGGTSGVDPFDSIDDANDEGSFPTSAPAGWDQATGGNWIMDPTNDDGLPSGTAGNGSCEGTEACVFIDRTTNQMWAKALSSLRNWEEAIGDCDALNYGNYTDWRLPTQKELLQAYIDGIYAMKGSTKLGVTYDYEYWTASTSSGNTDEAFQIRLHDTSQDDASKDDDYRVICIR